LVHGDLEGVAVVRPNVNIWWGIGVCFESKEQFKKSSMLRGDVVALTTTKVSWNIRSVDEGSGDHPMIRCEIRPSSKIVGREE
jgi:hypothetical protein